MRAVVLLLVGSCLCWWVWKSSGISHASAETSAETSKGYLLSADATPAESKTAESAGSEVPSTIPGRVESPTIPAPAPTSRSKPEPTRELETRTPESAVSSAPSAARSDASAEIALASALVHRPQSVIDGVGEAGVDPARRALAVCCAHALLGHPDQAREVGDKLLSEGSLSSAERAVVERSLQSKDVRAASASLARETPLVLAASMAWLAREGREALSAGHVRDAARVFSQLLLEEIRAPWKADRESMQSWTEDLRRAQAKYQWNRSGEWPSFDVKVEKGDSLISIRKRALAERPELLICTGQIERMNELHGSVLQPGQTLRIPTEKASMIVDLDAHWTFYLLGDLVAAAWEVGVGKPGSETRAGEYRVGEKREEPMWFPAGRAPVPYGDPENPLGTRWISLTHTDGSTTGLGFHGTNDPSSIGKDLSQGCVRMRNEEVEVLFEILPKGASVSIRP